MKQFYVEYYNHNNLRVGITISAWDAPSARQIVEAMPDCNYIVSYPKTL